MRQFVQVEAGVPLQWGLIPYSVRKMAPSHVSFPAGDAEYETVDLAEFGFETYNLVPMPVYDPITENIAILPPVLVGSDWTQVWSITPVSPPEISARTAQKLESDLASIRQQCQELIVATYPAFVQSNVSLGLYNDTYSTQMQADIASAIDESNRCEDILIGGGVPVPNWPVFTAVYPFTHKRHAPYPI